MNRTAAEAHAGQIDMAGAPYVLHPLRMMLGMSSTDERIVAVLHDVCEDCPGWTFDRLARCILVFARPRQAIP